MITLVNDIIKLSKLDEKSISLEKDDITSENEHYKFPAILPFSIRQENFLQPMKMPTRK